MTMVVCRVTRADRVRVGQMVDYWGITTLAYLTTLGSLSVGDTDVAVTWPEEFPNTTYLVVCGLDGPGSGLLTGRVPNVKPGSRTKAGCVVTVSNTGLLAIGAGVQLMVFGYHKTGLAVS